MRTHKWYSILLLVGLLAVVMILFVRADAAAQPDDTVPAIPLDMPENLTTDDANDIALGGGYVFWTRSPDEFCTVPGIVKSLNLVTRVENTLYSGCNAPWNIVADDTYVYYTDWTADEVRRFPLAGGVAPTILASSNGLIYHRALAQDDTYIFFGDNDGIHRVPKAGGMVVSLATDSNSDDSIELVADDTHVYWTERNALTDDMIRRVPITGGAAQTIVDESDVNGPDGPWAVTVDDTHVYWLELGNGDVSHVPKAGGAATDFVVTGGSYVGGSIAVNDTDVFWTDTTGTATGRLRRRAKSGGVINDLVLGQWGPGGVNLSASYVYWHNGDGVWRLPLDASVVAVDLTVAAMEITQAIQNLANDVPLVEDKTTFVRVYPAVDIADAPEVEAVLHGSRGGTPLPSSPLTAVDPDIFVHQSGYSRGSLSNSFNFWLPISWRSGTVTFRAEINPSAVIPETDHDNNNYSVTRTFNHRDPLCVDMVRVRTSPTTASIEDSGFWEIVGYLEAIYPVPEVRIYRGGMIEEVQLCWWGPFPYPCGGPYEMPDDGDKVLTRLWLYNAFTDDPSECNNDANYYGMVHPSEVSWYGQGYLPGDEAWGVMSADPNVLGAPMPNWFIPAGGPILAHELGHNYNRQHVDCPVGGPSNIDPGYPYNVCDMAPNDPTGYYGFSTQETAVIQPTEAADLMTYSHWLPKPYWISDYTYRALYSTLPAMMPISPYAVEVVEAQEVLAITGIISPTANTAVFESAYRFEPGILVKQEKLTRLMENMLIGPDQTYNLRLLDASDVVLVEQQFDLPDNGDPVTEARAFSMLMTYHSDAVKIVLIEGSTELASRSISPNAPSVTVLSPNGGGNYSDKLTVTWQASDLDDDELLYIVQYSADNGTHWETLAADYYTQTLVLEDMRSIPGSETALIRVIANDGVNTAHDTSDAVFRVAGQEPEVYISRPTAGSAFYSNHQILLKGNGLDPEDGMLSGSDLQWYVDGVPVGNGKETGVSGLAPGFHEITLEAEDSDNNTATESVMILVGDERIYLPIVLQNN